jgi:error-prone DNA polymerase
VRPGPIQGGMVHPYLRRRQGLEKVEYPSEAVKGVLERTLGVPIFQEQVMQLAVVAAGFTPGEADQLRRSMAAWKRKGGLEHFEEKLISGMLQRGYAIEFAQRIFQQIQGFGEYGFPESHAASFALLVYISAWLKCHEPAAFTCGLLNSLPMGFYAPAQLVADARRHDIEVRAVDVTVSAWDCALEPCAMAHAPALSTSSAQRGTALQPAIRLGFRMVSGFGEAAAERIAAARAASPFDDVEDLAKRSDLSRRDLDCLAASGALAPLAGHRRNAYWDAAGVERMTARDAPLLMEAKITEEPALFEAPSEGEDLVADYRSLGFSLGRHPLALLRGRLARLKMRTAEEVMAARHGQLIRAAGLVTCRQRPGTASGVTFVTLEDETGFINVVVWRDLAERQRTALLSSRLMGVMGVIEREGEVVHLVAGKLVDYSKLLGSLNTRSRNFH